jgi:hypothetical protein
MEYVVNSMPRALYHGKETRLNFLSRLCGPQGRYERVQKISPHTRKFKDKEPEF